MAILFQLTFLFQFHMHYEFQFCYQLTSLILILLILDADFVMIPLNIKSYYCYYLCTHKNITCTFYMHFKYLKLWKIGGSPLDSKSVHIWDLREKILESTLFEQIK